jgi:hypothetical protein
MLDRIAARELDPYTAVDQVLARALPKLTKLPESP